MHIKFLGLRSLIYPAPDLAASKSWWTKTLGKEPYFDDGGYVGYDVGGFEIGLNSHSTSLIGPTTYIGVDDVEAAKEYLLEQGAKLLSGPIDVGENIILAEFLSPQNEIFGVIYNPNFKAHSQ